MITSYDKSWETIIWFYQNIYYLIFLFISIVFWLTLYWNDDKKSKTTIAILFFINFLYLVFTFSIENIWLNTNQWLFLLWFLILGLVANYIKNRFWNLITILSVLWILTTILLVIVPLYHQWPDTQWFENNFSTKFIIYSKADINPSAATIQKDKKEYILSNWIYDYDLKINQSGSMIIFKSDKIYQNAFAYIVFWPKEFIQINPQSAIKIKENNYIEIVTWNIKYYPQNPKTFILTGKILPSLVINTEQIESIQKRYKSKLTEHILKQFWWTQNTNQNILKISEFILEVLYKMFPQKFSNNLENFNNFQIYISPQTQETNYKDQFKNEDIQKSIIKDIKNWINISNTIN
jgi:hypothetical protein